MALQFSTTLRNAMIDQIPVVVGSSEVIKIFTGPMPANCAAADTGTKLVEFDLPVTSWVAASGGAKTLAMLPRVTVAAASGIASGYFRLYDSTATTCHVQGTITLVAGGGDMTADNTSVTSGQTSELDSFTFTMPGA